MTTIFLPSIEDIYSEGLLVTLSYFSEGASLRRSHQSHPFYYNEYNVLLPSIEELYSEELQNQVVDKAFVKVGGFVFDIPDEFKEKGTMIQENYTNKLMVNPTQFYNHRPEK